MRRERRLFPSPAGAAMPFSLLDRLCDMPIAVLDTETTGASAAWGHRVIELGIVRLEGGRVVGEYQQLIDPLRPIGWGVTALTGISQQMVQGQPTFAQQWPAALQLLRGAVLVGHNVRFDLSFLHQEMAVLRTTLAESLQAQPPVLDTLRLARRQFGRGGNGLQNLSSRLGIPPAVAHRALADAQTTAAVLEKLLLSQQGFNCTLCDATLCQGGPMGLLPQGKTAPAPLPLELQEALDLRGLVRMEYLDANRHRTERIVQPLHIRRSGDQLLLVAHCQLRQAQRTFKLERIIAMHRVQAPDQQE